MTAISIKPNNFFLPPPVTNNIEQTQSLKLTRVIVLYYFFDILPAIKEINQIDHTICYLIKNGRLFAQYRFS